MTQTEREQMLMALLDITLEQFQERIATLTDADLVDEAVSEYGGHYYTHLQASADGVPGAQQLMMQTIATMADDTLRGVVRMFGKDPL